MSIHRKLMTGCAVAVLAFGLAACGSSDNDTADAPMTGPVTMPEPMPEPYEMALTGIVAADTAEAAQAAYDAVKDDVTAAQGEALQEAVDSRTAALATMARAAMQMASLMTAAGGVDTSGLMTQADIDAAQTAIDALQTAIDAAADVADTSMYQSQVDAAEMAVATAQGNVDTEGRMAIQTTTLMDASDALQTALDGLTGTPTQAQIDAVQTAVDGLNAAIMAGADLSDADKASYERAAAVAEGRIESAEKTLMAANAAAERERIIAEDEAARANLITASRLYGGIGSAPLDGEGDGERSAGYSGTNDADITVTYDPDLTLTGGDATTAVLTEDKKAVVHANHGWAGKRYTRTMPASAGTYEAIVYSNVEAPKEGKKFGHAGAANDDFQYTLTAGALPSASFMPADVAFTGVTRTAGTETFKLPMNMVSVMIPGSYHGVAGTYSCEPSDPAVAASCSATVAAKGFMVSSSGDTWTFTPGNANARVMDAADPAYASYGWWLRKAANDGPFTASAFVANKGDVPEATGLNLLQGTATYMGGAAGKYALSSSTGGTNDAGHFTARATLEADFTNNETDTAISGTLDKFIGADDQPRDDWKVELGGSAITNGGLIGGDAAADGTTPMTTWTIGGTDADASGNWTGSLRNNGTDNVPQVATGTFYSEYGAAGRMVGAFGANKQ